MTPRIEELTTRLCSEIAALDIDAQVQALNAVRRKLHEAGPFRDEPVDGVVWVRAEQIQANDYNPNRVAPPEMALLKRSIEVDGYTQPIVGFHDVRDGHSHTVVDGFHRHAIGSATPAIAKRLHGYLPVAEIRASQTGESNRMASTIRHNRARGTHSIDLMVGVVGELVQAGMSNEWIIKNIGMDADELLRLKQISGIAALFKDREFSRAWATNEADM
jgi:ParB-like chromosome segregation protein Spo0J